MKRQKVKSGGRILFVDDDNLVNDFVSNLLKVFGYDVTSAFDGIEALQIFQANPGKFDLLITDMTMPKMSGIALAKKVFDIRSDLPIVLMSGTLSLLSAKDMEKINIKIFVQKPFKVEEVIEVVEELLGE